MKLYLIAIALLLGISLEACVMGIPDYYPPPAPTKECKIYVRVDNGRWTCYTTEEFRRHIAPNIFPQED